MGNQAMRDMQNMTEDEMTREIQREQSRIRRDAENTALDETIRLFLQYGADRCDNEGKWHGSTISLEGADNLSAENGFIEVIHPKGGGLVWYRLTDAGRDALTAANAFLGERATRYVHRTKDFGIGEPIVFGFPILVPLTARPRRIDGALCLDERSVALRGIADAGKGARSFLGRPFR